MSSANEHRLRRLVREVIGTIIAADDDPVEALKVVDRDPYAALAAWDVISDPDFYIGLPDEDLQQALQGLYSLYAAKPDYADPEIIEAMIEHVEGLLGMGGDGIDIPWS